MDLRHLPTAYSTAHPPRPGLCDFCGRSLVNENGMDRKRVDTLTEEDLDDDDNDEENVEEKSEEVEEVDILP
ncbi:hypothetical protein C2G38_2235383, partial [Gigaspora rosea]